jgi:hypothetical protein
MSDNVKEVKVRQALKFSKAMDDDLHILAESSGMTYNRYIETVLSSHISAIKKLIIKQKDKNEQRKG